MNKCVYVLLDHRTPKKVYSYGNFSFEYEPFYVGKGDKSRPSQHTRLALKFPDRISFKNNKIRSIFTETNVKPKIMIYKSGLTDEQSKQLEKELITTIGTYLDEKPGPLTNVVKDPDHIPPPPKGDEHYSRKVPGLAKRIQDERVKNIGYKFLSHTKDGATRASLKVADGTSHMLGSKNPIHSVIQKENPKSVCPWLIGAATAKSKLGWFLRLEIEALHKQNPDLGYRSLSKLVNKELNILETYGLELDENLSMKIAKYKKWTPKKLQLWQQWKNSYNPI